MKINIFKRKKASPITPLRIQGIDDAPMTPEPDDTEIAAQAILEIILEKKAKKWKRHEKDKDLEKSGDRNGVAYYKHLSEHIREAYHAARQRALRYTAYTIYTDLSIQRRMPYDGYPEHRARPRSGRAQPDR